MNEPATPAVADALAAVYANITTVTGGPGEAALMGVAGDLRRGLPGRAGLSARAYIAAVRRRSGRGSDRTGDIESIQPRDGVG